MKTGNLLGLAFAVVFATTGAAQESPTKVRVAYDGFSMTSGPLIYADKQGLFKKFGLDVTPIFVDGGSMLTQAVVGGSVDIAQNGYTPALSAAVQGADIVIIGGISNKLPFQLVVKTSITNAERAQGPERRHQPLRLVDRHRGGLRAGAPQALADRREDSAARRRRHPHGGGDERTDRRHHGAISRHRRARAARISRAGRRDRHRGRLSEHLLCDQPQLSQEPPEVVKKFLMAMASAVHEYKRNPGVAIPLTQKFLDVKDPANAKAAYDAYVKVYPDDLRASLAGVALVLKEIAKKEPKAAAMKPEQFVDLTVLDRLDSEGFFAKLRATN